MNMVREAIIHAGGTRLVAQRCGVTVQAVQKWKVRLPPYRAVQLEKMTKRRFTRQQLCPNFPWGCRNA